MIRGNPHDFTAAAVAVSAERRHLALARAAATDVVAAPEWAGLDGAVTLALPDTLRRLEAAFEPADAAFAGCAAALDFHARELRVLRRREMQLLLQHDLTVSAELRDLAWRARELAYRTQAAIRALPTPDVAGLLALIDVYHALVATTAAHVVSVLARVLDAPLGAPVAAVVAPRLAWAAARTLDAAGVALLRLLDAAGRLTGPAEITARVGGDLGGTFDVEWRGALAAGPLVRAALAATADPTLLGPDEFGLVAAGPGRYVVILPGVVDLTHPQAGLDPRHRSARDTDVHAWPSLPAADPTSAIARNGYAALVAEAIGRVGVPAGAELTLVGHSFGADTALDLAVDPAFNTRYRVTHVLAAGYDAGAQLADVPLHTEVLVLQNSHDVAVLVEHAARPALTALDRLDEGLDRIAEGDVRPGLAEVEAGLAAMDRLAGDGHNPAEPGVRVRVPGHVQVVFDGGDAGAGHAQGNYLDYLDDLDGVAAPVAPAAAVAFLAGLTARGYRAGGPLRAVDISVPVEPHRSTGTAAVGVAA